MCGCGCRKVGHRKKHITRACRRELSLVNWSSRRGVHENHTYIYLQFFQVGKSVRVRLQEFDSRKGNTKGLLLGILGLLKIGKYCNEGTTARDWVGEIKEDYGCPR